MKQWRTYTSPEIDWLLPGKNQNFIETYIYTIRYFTIGPQNFLKTTKNETNFSNKRNTVSTLEAWKNIIKYEAFANFLIRQETESFGRSSE